jgi:TPR repeat protein
MLPYRVAIASLCLLASGATCKRSTQGEQGGEARGNADSTDFRTPVPTKRPRRAKAGCLADRMGKLLIDVKQSPDCGKDAADFKCARACGRGDAAACEEHAVAIDKGGETYDEEAHRLYQKACELGVAIACTNFAADLWTTSDYASLACAQRIFQKTCDADEPWGCGMLGRMLIEDDDATRADRARARAMLERACDRLGSFSCRVLAMELEGGNLGPYKRSQTRKLRARACATGDSDGCDAPRGASRTSRPASAEE